MAQRRLERRTLARVTLVPVHMRVAPGEVGDAAAERASVLAARCADFEESLSGCTHFYNQDKFIHKAAREVAEPGAPPRKQSIEEMFIQQMEDIYYPGYSEEMTREQAIRYEWELKEFQSQFSVKS